VDLAAPDKATSVEIDHKEIWSLAVRQIGVQYQATGHRSRLMDR